MRALGRGFGLLGIARNVARSSPQGAARVAARRHESRSGVTGGRDFLRLSSSAMVLPSPLCRASVLNGARYRHGASLEDQTTVVVWGKLRTFRSPEEDTEYFSEQVPTLLSEHGLPASTCNITGSVKGLNDPDLRLELTIDIPEGLNSPSLVYPINDAMNFQLLMFYIKGASTFSNQAQACLTLSKLQGFELQVSPVSKGVSVTASASLSPSGEYGNGYRLGGMGARLQKYYPFFPEAAELRKRVVIDALRETGFFSGSDVNKIVCASLKETSSLCDFFCESDGGSLGGKLSLIIPCSVGFSEGNELTPLALEDFSKAVLAATFQKVADLCRVGCDFPALPIP